MLNHGFACYNIYKTKDDRYMALGALEPKFWQDFCESVGRSNWNQENYFQPGPHQRILQDEIAELFRQKTQADWIAHFVNHDCCCEPVLHLDEVLADPHLRAREMVVELVHESWGAYRQLGIAPKLSGTPGKISSHAPELGEHTGVVLQGLGYSKDQIEELRLKEVV